MSPPPPPRARRRRRLRRTIPASDCSFTFAFAVFASVFARMVGLFWRTLAWGGRAFGDGARCCCRWLGARRWWIRCSRVVGLAHALMCVLRTCYLFLLRCLRTWEVVSARAGVGRAGVLVTARALAVVVGRAHAGGFAIARAVCFLKTYKPKLTTSRSPIPPTGRWVIGLPLKRRGFFSAPELPFPLDLPKSSK